jgi:putative transposase
MSHQEKQEKSCKSVIKLSETGINSEESKQSELHLVIEDTILTQLSHPINQSEKLYSIVESVHTNNETTLTDKPTTSKVFSQKVKSSKKSVQDSTTKEKVYNPFWDKFCLETSNKLYAATKIDLQGLDLNLSILCATPTILNSWFSTVLIYLPKKSLLKTSLQLSTSLVADYTDSENTKLKSKKIRIYPELKLRKLYKRWFAAARYCYNSAIAYQKNCFINNQKQPTKYDLRKIIMDSIPKWVDDCPYALRANAVFDAKTAFSKTKDKKEPKFKSCREMEHSIRLADTNWGAVKVDKKVSHFIPYPTYKTIIDGEIVKTKDLQLNPSEPLCEEMPSQFTILLDRGRWFICFAIEFQPQLNIKNNCIALDPGVRTFQTGFDGNKIMEIGKNDIGKISNLCQRLDKLQSRLKLATGRQNKRLRWKLKKESQSLRVRISNLQFEIHNKTAASLTKNYKHIFLPTFETSKMVSKNRRKINSKTARNMLTWSHYRFKQTLKFHALKRGCVVHDVTEEYTSKTCSKCGKVHEKLGGNAKFVCPSCGNTIPRDWNGAINIFIKSIRDLVNGLVSTNSEVDSPRYTVEFSS